MVDSYRKQLEDPSFKDLSFEERFGLMVDTEWARRKNNKLARLIRKSELYFSDACIEDIESMLTESLIELRLHVYQHVRIRRERGGSRNLRGTVSGTNRFAE